MPSDTAVVLRDIERHISLANEFVAGLGYEAFRNDARTVFAVIRCLEIISEASRRLPTELKDRHPSIPWMVSFTRSQVSVARSFDFAHGRLWGTRQETLLDLRVGPC